MTSRIPFGAVALFEQRRYRSKRASAIGLLELIYVTTVRSIRTGPGSGVLGLISSVLQMVLLVAVFYAMFALIGVRGSPLRGDFLLYIMSGVFMYLTHVKAVGAVFGSEDPTSPMMQHAPMNTIVSIISAVISATYIQILAVLSILFIYHTVMTPIYIYQPLQAFGCLLLAIFTGAAVGMLFLAAKPWAPGLVGSLRVVYTRVNMFASGKMFVANTLPGFLMPFFDWNPLFHVIDQTRGFIFLNYTPRYTSISYAVYVALALIVIGLMGEFIARKRLSLSWKVSAWRAR